jgi:hypothetical protein
MGVCAGQRHVTRVERTGCKTVGLAYVGFEPNTCHYLRNAPLAADSRLCGAFLLCLMVCHPGALWTGVLWCHGRIADGDRRGPERCPGVFPGLRGRSGGTVGFHR